MYILHVTRHPCKHSVVILSLLLLLPCACAQRGDKEPREKTVSEDPRQLIQTADSLKAEVEKARMQNDSVKHAIDSIRKRIREMKDDSARKGSLR